jgi:hypothetical protein
VPETSASRRERLDIGGAVLVSLALGCLVLPLSEGRQQDWPAWTFAMLAAVPFLAAAFLWFEGRMTARGGSPLLDLGLMAIPSFRRGVLVGTLFFFTTSFYVLFAIYEQEGFGTDPLFTGLAILPYGIGLFVGPLVTAPLAQLRPWLLTIGMAIQVAGYAGVAAVIVAGYNQWPVVLTVAARRLRPGHRVSKAVQHHAGRRRAASGRGRGGRADVGAADRCRDQRGGNRQPVLRRARPGLRAGCLCACLWHRPGGDHRRAGDRDAAVDSAPCSVSR